MDPPPEHPQRQALGTALRTRDPKGALAAGEALVSAFPTSALAWSGLADAWTLCGRPEVAVDARRHAVALRPNDPTLRFNLGTTLLAASDAAGAVAVLEPLARQLPTATRVHMNLGIALRDLGQLAPAATALATAGRHVPPNSRLAAEVEWNRSLVHLMGGDLRAGLPAYESRRLLPRFSLAAPRRIPPWDGRSTPEKLLVIAEQGLGDTLQYSRWIRRVAPLVGELVFAVQKPLVPLLGAGLDGPVRIIPLVQKLPVGGVDAWAPALSVPLLLGAIDRASHVESTPWVHADPTLLAHWRTRIAELPGTIKVGIVWQGNPTYKADHQRSVPLRAFAPLARVPGVTLVSLQKRHGREQLGNLPEGMQVLDLHDELDEATGPFLDTAAAMSALDVVVTSDTATLHLAGALGVRTLAAIAHVPDWRFGLRGDHLPEYPTVRLMRQASPGDWDGVATAMARWIDKHLR